MTHDSAFPGPVLRSLGRAAGTSCTPQEALLEVHARQPGEEDGRPTCDPEAQDHEPEVIVAWQHLRRKLAAELVCTSQNTRT